MKIIFLALALCAISTSAKAYDVRLKDIARIEGNREVSLVGFGLVVGLGGSGDSSRNSATLQSLANTLSRFGLKVEERDLSARNVAAVMITAELPPYSEPGDRIDVRVASTGDARSLSGGTLLLAPLYGPDEQLYALSQGALTVGGYQVESFANQTRKNHSTVGQISNGASVEKVSPTFSTEEGIINILLDEPDYTTAVRLADAINNRFGGQTAEAIHPGKISVKQPPNTAMMPLIAKLEAVSVTPDVEARVIVNERSGTIIAGSNVILGELSIAHGSLRIEVTTKYEVSQPSSQFRPTGNIGTAVVPDTEINVAEVNSPPMNLPAGTTVGDLVQALFKINLSAREVISILESIKAAGALHAELVIQ